MKMINALGSALAITAALTLATSCGDGAKTETKTGGDTSTTAAPVAGGVELKLELPKPEFQGTPKPVTLPDGLKQYKGGKRKPFMVPEGTVLLSKGKTVTASDDMPVVGDLEQITDGEKGASEGNFVEFSSGTQWVQVDLGAAKEISAIVLWHYHAQARAYYDVIVQVSDDADFVSGVTTLYNNDHDNSSTKGAGTDMAFVDTYEGWLVDGKSTKGRYVRLYSNGSTADEMNHYIEVEVYGK